MQFKLNGFDIAYYYKPQIICL